MISECEAHLRQSRVLDKFQHQFLRRSRLLVHVHLCGGNPVFYFLCLLNLINFFRDPACELERCSDGRSCGRFKKKNLTLSNPLYIFIDSYVASSPPNCFHHCVPVSLFVPQLVPPPHPPPSHRVVWLGHID